MQKFLTAILVCFIVGTHLSGATDKTASNNRTAVSAKEASQGEMSYAAISRTNPFEIVPTAGMEILDDIEDGDNAEMLADMIAYAKRFIGTRYVRGGKSPKGFDCSGFTSHVFKQFGYSLNASSSAQYGQGTKVERDEVEAGDLLFFTGRNSRSGRVGHVAIAIDNDPVTGEITFIHAAISGGIRIDRISAPYYAARYIGARRIL